MQYRATLEDKAIIFFASSDREAFLSAQFDADKYNRELLEVWEINENNKNIRRIL